MGIVSVGTALGFSVYRILLAFSQHYADAEGPARFQLLPSHAIWWFLPLFAALSLSWDIVLGIWARLGDHDFVSRYVDWTHAKAGFDSTRVLRWMSLLITLPIAIATLLAVPMHSTLHEAEIHVRGYSSVHSEVLQYKDVSRVFAVAGNKNRDGSVRVRAEIILECRNGRRWHSGDNRDFERVIDQQLANFLQQKTGIQLQYLETEADIP